MQLKKLMKALGIFTVAAGLMIMFVTPAAAKDPNTLYLGCVFDLTGYTQYYGIPTLKGVKLAVEQINAAGGIGGKYKIKLAVKDYRLRGKTAIKLTKTLLADGVDVVMGPATSAYAIVVGKLCAKKNVPMLGPHITSPSVPRAIGPYGFNVNSAGHIQAAVLARYAIEEGYKTAYILVSPDDAYTFELPEYFARAFEQMGGKLIGKCTYTLSQEDFTVEVRKIKKLKPQPDVIMSTAFGAYYASLLSSMRMAGIKIPYFGAEAIDEPSALGLGKVTEGVVFTTNSIAQPGNSMDKFNRDYKRKYGKENRGLYPALGYDAVKLIEAAVLKAGSTDGPAIRDALDTLKDVQGATGKITFAGRNRMAFRPIALCKMHNGKKTLIKWVIPNPADIPPLN